MRFLLEVKPQLLAEPSSLRRRCSHHVSFRKSESLPLLVGRLQQQSHGSRERVPFRLFADELPSPQCRDAVVAGAFTLLGQLPGGGDPAPGLEPIERGVERARFDLQQVFRGPLNVLGDGVAVTRSWQQRAQDQQIERARRRSTRDGGFGFIL